MIKLRVAIIALFFVAFAGLVVWESSQSVTSQRTLTDVGPIAEQVYLNTAALRDLQEQVARIETAIESHRNNDVSETNAQDERLKALEVTVDAHDRLLWVVMASVIGLLVEMGMRVLSKRSNLAKKE